jgi:hypothetical protein
MVKSAKKKANQPRHIPDKWYLFGMELRFRKNGQQNLKKIRKQYHNLEEWKSRAKTIREGILKGAELYPLPKRTPLNVVTHSYRKYNGYSVENVFFESIPGFFVSGNLYRPLNLSPNQLLPVILRPHGHTHNARFHADYQTLTAMLAIMGAITFTWDMVDFGESKQIPHNYKYVLPFQLWTSMRVLDFLLGLKGVDPSRVGMTGESGGGTQTFLCSAVDDRVTAPAPLIQVSSGFFGGCTCESTLPIHKGPNYKTNNAEIAALAAPRPQLIVSDGNDWTRAIPKREFPFIQSVYNLHGVKDLVENIHLLNEVHDLKENKRQAVYGFYAKTFGLNTSKIILPNGLIDESLVTIEPEEALHVFTAEHPRPDYALKNGDSIFKILKDLEKENTK